MAGRQVIDCVINTRSVAVVGVVLFVRPRCRIHIRRGALVPGQTVGSGALHFCRFREALHHGVGIGRALTLVVVRVHQVGVARRNGRAAHKTVRVARKPLTGAVAAAGRVRHGEAFAVVFQDGRVRTRRAVHKLRFKREHVAVPG